jgi:hypothetical protein
MDKQCRTVRPAAQFIVVKWQAEYCKTPSQRSYPHVVLQTIHSVAYGRTSSTTWCLSSIVHVNVARSSKDGLTDRDKAQSCESQAKDLAGRMVRLQDKLNNPYALFLACPEDLFELPSQPCELTADAGEEKHPMVWIGGRTGRACM